MLFYISKLAIFFVNKIAPNNKINSIVNKIALVCGTRHLSAGRG